MIGASGRRHLGEPGFFRRRLRAPFGRRLPASRWRSRPDRVERSAGAAHEVEVESGRCRAPPIGIDKQHPEVGDLGHRLARPTLAQQLAEGHHSAHLSPLLGDRGSDLSRGKPLAITSMLPIGSSGRCPPSLPRRGTSRGPPRRRRRSLPRPRAWLPAASHRPWSGRVGAGAAEVPVLEPVRVALERDDLWMGRGGRSAPLRRSRRRRSRPSGDELVRVTISERTRSGGRRAFAAAPVPTGVRVRETF